MSLNRIRTSAGRLRSGVALICLLGIVGWGQESRAQTAKPVRPAVMAFSVEMAQLKASPISPMLGEWESIPVTQGPWSMIAGAESLSGSFSLPASAQDLMTMGPNEDIPFDFVVQVNFPDSAAMAKVWDALTSEFEPTEVDGISGFRLRNNETPNMLFAQLGDVSMAVGTPAFIKQAGRGSNSNGKGVNDLLGTLPKHSVKLALDLSNSTDLLDEVKEILDGQLPPEAAPFFEVAMKVESLRFSFDMESEKLLVLGVRGRDEEATTEIFQTVDGLLNMAKFAAGAQLAQLKEDSPKTAEVASRLIAALKPRNEGSEMTMEVARPEGMKEMLEESIANARKAALEAQLQNNLRQAALSVHNYYDSYGSFPFSGGADEFSRDLSWRVRILPFIDEAGLYGQIEKSEGFQSAANRAFSEQMPAILGKDSKSRSNISHIALDQPVAKFQDVNDGTSNTIMLVVYQPGQAWMDPKGLTVDEAVKLFTDLEEGESLATAYYDGSVRRLGRSSITPDEFRSALLPNDGK